jgi:hypothetical protein
LTDLLATSILAAMRRQPVHSRAAPRSWRQVVARVALIAATLGACRAPAARAPEVEVRSGVRQLERIPLALPPGISGLSGLSHDDRGHLLAIAERSRTIVEMDPRGGNLVLRPLGGVPGGLDTESIAWLGDGRVAIGTESHEEGRVGETVLVAARRGDGFAVEEQLEVPYSLWGLGGGRDNLGLEALCVADGTMLAAIEAPVVEGDVRLVPLARYDLIARRWTAFRLRLTSATGKLSALECRPRPDGDLDVVAIERHYAVTRVLGFTISRLGVGQDLTPTVRADLADLLRAGENYEGIEWLARDEIALVTDNDHGGPKGPSLLVLLKLMGLPSRP